MGRKKDELRQELALERATREQVTSELDALRAQIAAGELAPPFRLVTDAPPTPIRLKIAQALGIDMTRTPNLTDEVILEAVERLKNPHLDRYGDALVVNKTNDSLAEAINHNRQERSDLLDQVTKARSIINRLAAALDVGSWNADGDEIVEKAQRFSGFRYWLRNRYRDALALLANENCVESRVVLERQVGEIRAVIACLVAEKDLAKFLMGGGKQISESILDLAQVPAPVGTTYLDTQFCADDLERVKRALFEIVGMSEHAPKRDEQIMLIFNTLCASTVATQEFISFMNVVVLPMLRKQHAAYAHPAPTEH